MQCFKTMAVSICHIVLSVCGWGEVGVYHRLLGVNSKLLVVMYTKVHRNPAIPVISLLGVRAPFSTETSS